MALKNELDPNLAGPDLTLVGMGALLSGLEYARDILGMYANDIRAAMAAAQSDVAEPLRKKRPGFSPSVREALNEAKGGWASMTPEERSAEMKRRRAVAEQNKQLGPMVNHPRDPRHPNHDRWIANLRKSQKKYWNNMTPAQKKAKIAALAVNRSKPSPKMENVA